MAAVLSDGVSARALHRGLIAALAGRLERRMAWSLSASERDLYVSIGGDTLTGPVSRHAVA